MGLVRLIAKLLLISCLLVMMGCSKTIVVYAGLARCPEEATGAVRIATNRPIEITIAGDKKTFAKKDFCGYYIVSGADLKTMVKAMRELQHGDR